MRQLLIVVVATLFSVALAGAARAQQPVPAAPTDLVAEAVPVVPTTIGLQWRDNADNEDSFSIERSHTGETGPWESVAFAATTDACTLATERQCYYFDRMLAPETTYWYRLTAANGAGMSSYSNVASATTGSLPPPAPGEIRGYVFHDRNRNGLLDAGEEGLGGR